MIIIGYNESSTVPPDWFINESPTAIDSLIYYEPYKFSVISEEDTIKQIKIENALKSIKTIVQLTRTYKQSLYVSFKANMCVVLRSMQSISGRITRKLKRRQGKI